MTTTILRKLDTFENALTVPPRGIKLEGQHYPILLTPLSPHLTNRAALVFVRPSVLSSADDLAEYGSETYHDVFEEGDSGYDHHPPIEGARLVAWFRTSEPGRKYNVDFSCECVAGHSFTLVSSAGASETASVPEGAELETNHLYPVLVGMTFTPQTDSWRAFTLSSDAHWKLKSFEVVQFPDS